MGNGAPLTTHQIICLLLRHYVKNRGMTGKVVKALTTTSMVDRMCAELGLKLIETGVGFKYIASEILKGGVLLGFEESGALVSRATSRNATVSPPDSFYWKCWPWSANP